MTSEESHEELFLPWIRCSCSKSLVCRPCYLDLKTQNERLCQLCDGTRYHLVKCECEDCTCDRDQYYKHDRCDGKCYHSLKTEYMEETPVVHLYTEKDMQNFKHDTVNWTSDKGGFWEELGIKKESMLFDLIRRLLSRDIQEVYDFLENDYADFGMGSAKHIIHKFEHILKNSWSNSPSQVFEILETTFACYPEYLRYLNITKILEKQKDLELSMREWFEAVGIDPANGLAYLIMCLLEHGKLDASHLYGAVEDMLQGETLQLLNSKPIPKNLKEKARTYAGPLADYDFLTHLTFEVLASNECFNNLGAADRIF